MIKFFNPYPPGTVLHKLLDGAEKWEEMSADEIAAELECSVITVYGVFYKIRRELGYQIKRRDKRKKHNVVSENGNIYTPGTIVSELYNGNWSGKTTADIAHELGTTAANIRNCVWQIRRDTGKFVEFLDGRRVRWKRGKAKTYQ